MNPSLRNGVDTVIRHGNIALADHHRWANTYRGSTPEDVGEAINVAMTLRARENEGDAK